MKATRLKTFFSFELIIAIIMMLLAYGLFAQTSSTQPKTQVQVHKYLDDKGRLMGYDSVYSYSWMGKPGSTNQVLHDFRQLGKAGVSPFTSPFDRYQWYFNQDFTNKMARMRDEMRRSMQEMMDALKLQQQSMNKLKSNILSGEKTL